MEVIWQSKFRPKQSRMRTCLINLGLQYRRPLLQPLTLAPQLSHAQLLTRYLKYTRCQGSAISLQEPAHVKQDFNPPSYFQPANWWGFGHMCRFLSDCGSAHCKLNRDGSKLEPNRANLYNSAPFAMHFTGPCTDTLQPHPHGGSPIKA